MKNTLAGCLLNNASKSLTALSKSPNWRPEIDRNVVDLTVHCGDDSVFIILSHTCNANVGLQRTIHHRLTANGSSSLVWSFKLNNKKPITSNRGMASEDANLPSINCFQVESSSVSMGAISSSKMLVHSDCSRTCHV